MTAGVTRIGARPTAIQRFHDQHPVGADLILIAVLACLIYGAIWFNLAQFLITDWVVWVTGTYPTGF